jgi:hypothetical protein
MLESNLFSALILLLLFIVFVIELFRKSNLSGKTKHKYRYVQNPSHQAGSLNLGPPPRKRH